MIKKIYKIVFLLLKFFFGAIFAMFLLLFLMFLGGRYIEYGKCVQLPNGIIVTYEAYFNFSDQYLIPLIVVKGPDGTQFSRGNGHIFYFSDTTAWWKDNYSQTHGDQLDGEILFYRPDMGLVKTAGKPDLRKQLRQEAGVLLEEGGKISNTNVLGIWLFLKDDPKYSSRDCHMKIITYEKYHPRF